MATSLEQFAALTKPNRRQSWRAIRAEIGRTDPPLLVAIEAALIDPATPRAQIITALPKLGYDIGRMGIENWRADVLSR